MTVEPHVVRTTKRKPDTCAVCGGAPVVSAVHHPRAATLHLGGRAWAHPDLAPLIRNLYVPGGGDTLAIGRHPENPRRGDHEAIVKSVLNNGVYTPPKVQRSTTYVLAGNHSFDAMVDAGAVRMPWVWLDVDDREARRIMADDNRTAELGGYDQAMLLENLRALDATGDLALTAWTSDDLAELERAARAMPVALTDADDAPDVPDGPTVTQPGDVWRLGAHRMVVGDATDVAVYDALMGDEHAACVWTDPPYGVEYVGKTGDALTIRNDGAAGLPDLLAATFDHLLAHTAPGAAWFLACPATGRLHHVFAEALIARDVLRQGLVWAKDQFVLGRSDYHYSHEPILYGRTPSNGHGRFGRGGDGWHGPNNETSVWTIARPRQSKEHPTMKPVELVARALRNSTRPGDLVLDPFAGSGTALIACHQEDRTARLIELDPRYADVICRRYQQHTGTVPVRDGQQVDFLA